MNWTLQMNPGNNVVSQAKEALNVPEGWEEIKSGHLIVGDKVLSLDGWRTPKRLGTNAKVLIAIRRIKE